MELEEMKQLWQQYDKKLQENKLLNERIIADMLKDRSGNAINKMLQWEWANVVTSGLCLLVFLAMWPARGTGAILACHLFSLLLFAGTLGFAVYKIRLLWAIDLGVQSVTDAGEKIECFRLVIAKERIVSIFALPPIMIVVYAVVHYWVHGQNLFDKPGAYLWQIGLGVVAALTGALITYRVVYFNGIKKIKNNLAEIAAFKQ